MKLLLIYVAALVSMLAVASVAEKSVVGHLCWCWQPLHKAVLTASKAVSTEFVPFGAYGTEGDWNNPDKIVLLTYSEDQGRRLFYQHCVWCHADTTPAGPSNRNNIQPEPPLLNDQAALSQKSDAALEQTISLGGSALGKSAMMPAYGSTLTQNDIGDLVAYIRKIASSNNTQASLSKDSRGGNAQ
jgi:mono/diheme cytochrome c family protein